MRRFFFVLGVVFAVIIVAIGGVIGVAAYRGSALDAESKAYVDQAVVAVGTNWDRAEFLARASPDLLRKISAEQIVALFEQLASFGRLVRYDGASGQAVMSAMLGIGTSVRAHYEADATFANGAAHFRIDLSKRDARWMIDGFFVDLTPPAAKPATTPI